MKLLNMFDRGQNRMVRRLWISRARVAAFGFVLLGLTSVASAGPIDLKLSYTVSCSGSGYAPCPEITNIVVYNTYELGGFGAWWPTSLPADGGVINDPFLKSTDNMPLQGLILGVSTVESVQHLVMMLDEKKAVLFVLSGVWPFDPAHPEADVINDLVFFTGTDRRTLDADGQAAWDLAANRVDSFVSDADAWFPMGTFLTLPPSLTTGTIVTGDFSVLQFSGGTTIGTGTASMEYSPTAEPVPEPATLSLVGLGLVAAAATRLRGRKSS